MAVHMSEDEFLALGIEVQREGFTALNQELDTSTAHVEKLDAAVQAVGEISTEPLQKLSSGFAQTNKQIQETNDSLDKLRAGLGDMPDSGGGGIGFGGASGLRRTGGALTQLGFGEVGGVVSRIGDIAQVGKEIQVAGEAAQTGLAAAGVGLGELVAVAGPLALAAGGIAVVFKQLTDTIAEGRKEVEKADNDLVEYFKTTATGTSEQINKQIQGQQVIQDANEKAIKINLDKINGLITQGGADRGLSPEMIAEMKKNAAAAIRTNDPGLLAGIDLNLPANMLPGIHSLVEESAKLATASKDAGDKIGIYTSALNDANVKANDAAQTLLDFRHAAEGSSQQVKAEIQAKKDDQDAIKIRIAYLQASGDTSEATNKKLQELTRQYDADGQAIDTLTKQVLPITEKREAEAQAIKDTQKAVEAGTRAQDTYTKSLENTRQQLDNQIQNAKTREQQQEEANRPGSIQDMQAREKIRTEESRKETQLAQETADHIVDIRAKEGQAEHQILVELARQYQDDNIKFYEQQQLDAKDHEQRITQIKRDAQDAELDDIANRDFAKLAQDQRGAQKQQDQEDQKYTQQEQQLAAHLQAEQKQQQVAAEHRLEDLRNNEAIQIQEQQIADQRKLDARRQSEQYQLDDLTTAEGYKIQILQVGLRDEIALYQQASMQRVQILQNELQAAQAQASQQIYKANAGGTGAFGFANSMNDAIGAIGEALFG